MRASILTLTLLAATFAGCLASDDSGDNVAVGDAPATAGAIFELPETITGLAVQTSLDLGAGGNGIWIDEERFILFASVAAGGLRIVDIRDPAAPVEMGTIDTGYARDVDLLEWDNRSFAVLAAGGQGMTIVDVTDPYAPFLVAQTKDYSVHNLASVPGTPYVYDSSGFAPRKLIPVLDLTVPETPVWHEITIPTTINNIPIQSDGCHDITVRVDLGYAYCAGGGSFYVAGGGETMIMKIDDPLKPEFVGVIDNPSIVYHHQALPSEDGKFLFIDDEHIIVDNCQGADIPTMGDRGQTTGAMWIYDISDPSLPVMRSWVQPMVPVSPNCGSHFGDLIDDSGMVAFGWYSGGTILIDVSDPDAPQVVDMQAPTGSTWDARYFNGHVYGSAGQLDVFRLV